MGKNRSKSKHKNDDDAIVVEDERFAVSRPQFRASSSFQTVQGGGRKQLASQGNKIVLDERFSSVLTDSRFQLQEKDKYGRKQRRKSKKKEAGNRNPELEAFYKVAGEEETEEPKEDHHDDDSSSTTSTPTSDSQEKQKDNNQKSAAGKNDGDMDPASRIAYLTSLSRGEVDVSSSSSSDDDDDDDDHSADSSGEDEHETSALEDPVHGTAGILDPSTKLKEDHLEITYDSSPYLAVTNLDWAHIRAVDIYAILSSFCPPGSVLRVQVFLSDYGKTKLKQEIEQGPGMLWKKTRKEKKDTSSNNAGEDMDEPDVSDEEESSASDRDGEDDGLDENGNQQKIMETYEDFIQATKEDLQQQQKSDFDPEKLRAYEASKLKYYFAVAEFSTSEVADMAYKEVDGMEFEHSSAAVDMRSIPKDAIHDVVRARELRDEATSLPSNYAPSAFIVTALQQTNVQCTWEAGDTQRERLLTKYASAEQWAACAEEDDLKAYLASDNSSDNDDSDNESDAPNAKGANLRKLLGLDDESDKEGGAAASNAGSSDDSSGDDSDREVSKEIKYDPGKTNLQEKIKAKLQAKEASPKEELTPWEKYKEKRREKRKEKRDAVRRKRSDVTMEDGAATTKRRPEILEEEGDHDDADRKKPSKEELELLLAGDNDEEAEKDFDMRGLQRIEKNKDKRLRGSRKRKEETLAADVAGKDFEIDLKDSRFAAVLDGSDGRFGIDRTDPQYKETPAMREIMEEQKARRKKRRTKLSSPSKEKTLVPPDVVEGSSNMKSSGSAALSSLVKSLKTKVAKT
jgi:hypothetical protein